MWDWVLKLDELRRSQRACVLATVVDSVGSSPRKMGARMIVVSPDEFYGTVGGGKGESLVMQRALLALVGEFDTELYTFELTEASGQVCGGKVRVLIEKLGKPSRLYLFGAGHVARAISQVLVASVFAVTVIDQREQWIHAKELADHVSRVDNDPVLFARDLGPCKNDCAVVLTHDHGLDYDIVHALMAKDLGFLGVIGSDNKRRNFLDRLQGAGFSDTQLLRLHCPLGAVRAGSAPSEIAISLAAQLLDWFYNRERYT